MKTLYRKYRPTSLDEVICEDQVVEPLKSAISSGKFSHAYLFTGPRGTGKTSCARIFAHEINNFPYSVEDNYVDIIEIDAASNTGVDNIRDLREKAVIAPTEGKYKIYIIDEVHMLSKSAFNALLKTLEEPPEHVVFLLATTDLEKVPVTITSRVQIFTFRLASPEAMLPHLQKICEKENIKITDDALNIIIERGGGSFRDTLSLLDQISTLKSDTITGSDVTTVLGLPTDQLITDIITSYQSQDLQKISASLKDAFSAGIRPEIISELLIKKILKNPTADLISLLSRLPEVKNSFPEAKLLVALTSGFISSELSQPAMAPIRPAPSPLPPREATAPSRPVETSSPEPKTPALATSPAPSPQTSTFNFATYLESVKRSSVGAAIWLKKCKYQYSGDTLHLYPDNPTTKGIIESANNRRVLMDNLGTSGLSIHEPGEKPSSNTQKSSTNDASLDLISGIMGGVLEVNDGGESPF